jgi:hypothetical protein
MATEVPRFSEPPVKAQVTSFLFRHPGHTSSSAVPTLPWSVQLAPQRSNSRPNHYRLRLTETPRRTASAKHTGT